MNSSLSRKKGAFALPDESGHGEQVAAKVGGVSAFAPASQNANPFAPIVVNLQSHSEISDCRLNKIRELYKCVYRYYDCEIAPDKCLEMIVVMDDCMEKDQDIFAQGDRLFGLAREIEQQRLMKGQELRTFAVKYLPVDQEAKDALKRSRSAFG